MIALLDLSAAMRRLQLAYIPDRRFGVSVALIIPQRPNPPNILRRTAIRSQQRSVPQGSILGPLLFLLYVAELAEVIAAHGFTGHFYANDSQRTGC